MDIGRILEIMASMLALGLSLWMIRDKIATVRSGLLHDAMAICEELRKQCEAERKARLEAEQAVEDCEKRYEKALKRIGRAEVNSDDRRLHRTDTQQP